MAEIEGRSMIYLKSEIEIRPGRISEMLDLLKLRIFPILEGKGGWKVMGCFVQQTGQLNTIVDIWALDDFGHFERAYSIFREDPEYPEIRRFLDTYVEKERLIFMAHQYGAIASLEN
jgi:hypothetical protein